MGEIADMMLDGTMCQFCGVFLDGEPLGIPRYCAECAPKISDFIDVYKFEPEIDVEMRRIVNRPLINDLLNRMQNGKDSGNHPETGK
jgi:hypothetical protein